MEHNNNIKKYRSFYKKYYKIDFDNNFDIHHIDLNHDNNDINNLMLLPKKLHNKYHWLLNSVNNDDNNIFQKTFNSIIQSSILNGDNYNLKSIKELVEVIQECNIWYDYKLYLDGTIPNVHNITEKMLKGAR